MERLLESWPAAAFTFFMEGLLMYFPEEDVRRLLGSVCSFAFELKIGIAGGNFKRILKPMPTHW